MFGELFGEVKPFRMLHVVSPSTLNGTVISQEQACVTTNEAVQPCVLTGGSRIQTSGKPRLGGPLLLGRRRPSGLGKRPATPGRVSWPSRRSVRVARSVTSIARSDALPPAAASDRARTPGCVGRRGLTGGASPGDGDLPCAPCSVPSERIVSTTDTPRRSRRQSGTPAILTA